jgi:hypothetical protein
MLKKNIIGLGISIFLLGTPPAKSEEECLQIIKACDSLNSKLKLQTELQRQLIADLEHNTKHLTVRVEELDKWYRQPGLVIPTSILLGILIGAQNRSK